MNFKKGLAVTVAALGLSLSAQASDINIGGVVWDPDSLFDFSSTSSLIEDQLNLTPGPGFVDELTGFGRINEFNGANQATFCPSCELTFQFGGFKVANVIPGPPTEIAFTGGWINFYVDHSADYDPTSYASAGDEAGSNALFLRLEAHEVFDVTHGIMASITAELDSFGAGSDKGEGSSLMDAVGGMALGNFDTDGKADGADFVFTSSFQPLPGGDNGEGYELFGSADLSGNSIPEPTSVALLGLGLLGFAASRKRKA